ncbi:MAG: hypothetical protein K2P14_10800 [Anaeroplasmataceae bacterium]|nr:hypothetical protein [Anaeroplasmataceae bacterium]
MVGKYRIQCKTPTLSFDFEIKRQYTEVIGDSGTGKTLFTTAVANKYDTGTFTFKVTNDVELLVFTLNDLRKPLEKGVIYVIDEADCSVIFDNSENLRMFHSIAKYSDCYFILLCRNILNGVPCSLNEVYEFVHVIEDGTVTAVLSEAYEWRNEDVVYPTSIVVEDSQLGYRFYRETIKEGINVISSNGNTGITGNLKERLIYKEKVIFLIADGAVFAPIYARLLEYKLLNIDAVDIRLFLKESFEYIILDSGVVSCNLKYLRQTEDYADTTRFLSWEAFYTDLLVKLMSKTKYRYSKSGNKFEVLLLEKGNVKKMYQYIREIDTMAIKDEYIQ